MGAPKDISPWPAQASQYLEQAYALEEGQEFARALQACESALQLAPEWAEVHNLHGILLEGLDRKEEAIAAYRQAVQLAPDFEDARENLLGAERDLAVEEREAALAARAALPPPIPGDDLFTVAAYRYPVEAYLAKTRLDWEGIECYVADDRLATWNWFYCCAMGGVKLRVKGSDWAAARDVLQQEPLDVDQVAEEAALDEPRCPVCDSRDVHYELFSLPLVFASWLLLGFPLPIFKRKWRCLKCGCQWDEGELEDVEDAEDRE